MLNIKYSLMFKGDGYYLYGIILYSSFLEKELVEKCTCIWWHLQPSLEVFAE